MKNRYKAITLLTCFLSISAFAQKSIVDVWQCKLKPNKTMKDAGALNEKWVKFMNENVKGGGINSYDLEPKVGKHGSFMFIDVYPNMQSWAAGDNMMESTKEGKVLLKEFRSLADCTSNALYSSTKH